VVTGPWDRSVAAYMDRHGLTDLSLNRGMGWPGRGIDFLHQIPLLRSLAVLDWNTSDFRPLLTHADTLEYLIFECNPKTIVRLEQLPALHRLGLKWERGWEGLLDGTAHELRHLRVQNWPYPDLTAIASLRALENFHVIGSRRLRDIAGLRDRVGLKQLELTWCHQVEGFEVLATCTGLDWLELDCKTLKSIAFVSALRHLEVLILGKAEIESLAPVEACTALRRLGLPGGRVRDTDLSVLLRLPKLEWAGIRRRKEYRPSVDEINVSCAPRRKSGS